MVCVAYLQVSGSPPHLRYLLQRLRTRLPMQKLLVGLWPSDDPMLANEAARRLLGADICVSTLTAAVENCLEQARQPVAETMAA